MGRELNRLTAVAVKKAACESTASGPKLIADGGGLYLQVMPSGSKSWLYRYTRDGTAKAVGLGPLHAVSLAEAREEASRLRQLVRQRRDPQRERAQQAAARVASERRTFRQCAEEYIPSIKEEHKNEKHHAQWYSSLKTYVYPVIGDVPVCEITVQMIRDVLTRDNAWVEKNETMSRIQQRIERILGWATVLGYRSGENPARWKNFLSEVLPSKRAVKNVRHHPALPYSSIPAFLAELRQQPLSMTVVALEFLTLTAARTGEVIGARWSEIDEAGKVWTVPASRMKAGRTHRVPLSDEALSLIQLVKKHREASDYIFRGMKAGTHISNMAMLQLMRRMNRTEVPHGMRSAFRDWCAETTSYPRELAEAALAHVLESRVEAAYQRGDLLERRRSLMSDWAAYCHQGLRGFSEPVLKVK